METTTRKQALQYGLSSLGLAIGLFYAYKTGKKFWGYVGFALLGSLAGGAIGSIGSSLIFKEDN